MLFEPRFKRPFGYTFYHMIIIQAALVLAMCNEHYAMIQHNTRHCINTTHLCEALNINDFDEVREVIHLLCELPDVHQQSVILLGVFLQETPTKVK